MASITINAGDMYVTNGSVSGNTLTTTGSEIVVRIDSTKIDYQIDNTLVSIAVPVSAGNRGSKTPYSRAIDLKRLKETVTVQGVLSDESGESAITKRNNINSLLKNGNALTIVWAKNYATNEYQTLFTPNSDPEVNTGVAIISVGYTETVGLVGEAVGGATDQEPPEKNIAINISFVRGKDLI